MTQVTRILLLEDNESDAVLIQRELAQLALPTELRVAQTGEEFRQELTRFQPDVILSDFTVPGFSGPAALTMASEQCPDAPFIFVSGTIGEEEAIEALRGGASDYVLKNNLARLNHAVERAIGETKARTARRQAEAALLAAERRYEGLVELSPDAIYVVADRKIAFINQAGLALYGAENPGQLVGRPSTDLVHSDSLGIVTTRMRQMLEYGEAQTRIEQKHVRLDGSTVHVELTSAPMEFEGRQAILVLARDISDRKAAAETARQAEAHALEILESITDAFFSLDRDWCFTYVNNRAEELLLHDKASLLGCNVWEKFPEAVGSRFYDEYHRAFAEQTAVQFEEYYPPLSTWFEVRAYPRENGLSVYFRDITARKRAQERLAMEHAVTGALAGGGSPQSVVSRILQTVCETMGWACGGCWLVDAADDSLECFELWGLDTPPIRRFLGFCRNKAFNPGPKGPLGQILRTGAPVWIPDIDSENDMVRAEIAKEAGLHSSFAFPMIASGTTLGVMEFFSANRQQPDEDLLALSVSLGNAIGSYWMRKMAEGAAHLRQRALESSVNGIVITDPTRPDHPIEYVNPAFERITGYTQDEVIGRNCRFLQGEEHEQPEVARIRSAVLAHSQVQVTLRNFRKDGTLFWNELHIAPVRDESGGVVRFIGVLNDVTERKRYEAELEYRATHDALTGLANRNLFKDRLHYAIAYGQRHERTVGIVTINLDNFTLINDSFGHDVGDTVLRNAASRLAASVRQTDTAARLGGDEFGLLFSDVEDADAISQLAERVFSILSKAIWIDGQEIFLTCSAGISVFPSDAKDADTALRNADIALHRAKAAGRNAFEFYTAETNARSIERLSLATGLRRALEREEFCLYFQPQIDIRTGALSGVEALVRWRHPEHGLMSPGQFIPVAEDTGLIVPIGQWVLRTACERARHMIDALGHPLTMSVNLSARQFRQTDLATFIGNTLSSAGLPAEALELELTESTVALDTSFAAQTMETLKSQGIRIAIDDFGTGYSSLSHLKRFPVDRLKIDMSFVSGITSDPDDAAICRTVIALGKNLDMHVIAEGVETAPQLAFLREHGCNEAQGFLFGRPMPEDSFLEWARRAAALASGSPGAKQ
ncbi:MAG: EAL domain-containing protein [Burkholderiales bacterium]